MKKQKRGDRYFAMSCCQHALEQFKAYRITGFSNGNRNIPLYEEIKLSYEETCLCGNTQICRGKDAALAELKRILRARVRNKKQYYTIGFLTKNGRQFVYLNELRFEKANLKTMFDAYKELKLRLADENWLVKPIPESVEVSHLEIDPKRPVFIRMVEKDSVYSRRHSG